VTLKYTLVVRDPSGQAVALVEGSEVPEWASDLVQPDDLVGDPESGSQDGRPAGNASLEDWQEFARSQGATDADLDGMNRNALRDQYGK
jgi:hypothetical protein